MSKNLLLLVAFLMTSTSLFAQWANMPTRSGRLVGIPTVNRPPATPSLELFVLNDQQRQQVINSSTDFLALKGKYEAAAAEIGGSFIGFTHLKVTKLNTVSENQCKATIILTAETDMGNNTTKIVDEVYITGEKAGSGYNFQYSLRFSCEELEGLTREDGTYLIGDRKVVETRLEMKSELDNFEIHRSDIENISNQ